MFTGCVLLSLLALTGTSMARNQTQRLVLNAYAPGHTGMAGPVSTSPLTAGEEYLVQVHGTYSAYPATLMDGTYGWKVCGNPVDPPSGSGFDDLEGQDAGFIFAKPRPIRKACPPIPFVNPNFVISTTGPLGTFANQAPDGSPTAPTRHHSYSYLIMGTGAPASFGLDDTNTTDNYGSLDISVGPLPPE